MKKVKKLTSAEKKQWLDDFAKILDSDEGGEFIQFIEQGRKKQEKEISQEIKRGSKTFAYMRVSSRQQTFKSQQHELKDNGYEISNENCFTDKISGSVSDREGWNKLIQTLQVGDTVVSYSLDRIGRDTIDVLLKVKFLLDNGINVKFISPNFPLEANSPLSTLFIAIFSAIAEFERKRIQERVKAGLAAKKAAGEKLGPKPYSKAIRQQVVNGYIAGLSVKEIRNNIRKDHDKLISPKTVYRIVDEFKLDDIKMQEVRQNRSARRKGEFTLDGGSASLEEKDILFS